MVEFVFNSSSVFGGYNESFLGNVTELVNFDDWIFHVYFGFISFGGLLDFIYVLGLMRCRRTGILSLVMQLCIIDVSTIFLAIVEVLTLKYRTWIFSLEICPLYSGSEILINSLILWFIICINFQAISLWNLHAKETNKTVFRKESNECLVTKKEKENSCRFLNIDYRRSNDISVIVPAILIWFFCMSLSIPNFTLTSIYKIEPDVKLCTVLDTSYGYIIQVLLLVFKVILPLPLLMFSLLSIAFILIKTRLIKNDNTKDVLELKALLFYCLALTFCYMLTSFQRQLLYAFNMIWHDYNDSSNIFKIPPYYNYQLDAKDNIILTMFHYTGIVFRAILCSFLLPKFRKLIKNKVFVCCKWEK